jgi:hypothetical protein
MSKVHIGYRWLAVIACFSAITAMAQENVKIGRSEIGLPAGGRWSVVDVALEGVKYTGDVSGTIPMETKRLSYKTSEGLTKLVIVSSMTKGAVSAQMSWENHCTSFNPDEHLFVKDAGSFNRLDCLVVARIPRFMTFLDSAKGLQALFTTDTPHTISGYYVEYSKGLSNGAQATSYVLLPSDFQGLAEGAINNGSKIPNSVIRWASEFAKANSSGLTSLTGSWTLPPLIFN